MSPQARDRAAQISFMFFDVDGVMTDGGLYYDGHGEALKRFCVLDGFGLKALAATGIGIGIISGRSHPAVNVRAAELGIQTVFQGIEDKRSKVSTWAQAMGLSLLQIGHMGDDIADLLLFKSIGFSATVPNAIEEVQQSADWIATRYGGQGAVREACAFIIASRS